MSSGAWLKTSRSSSSRGVTKRKGTSVEKRRISTRNRLKVERLRESLNDLHLDEIESIATKSKTCKNALRLQVHLRDYQSDGGTSTGISVLNDNQIPLGPNSILKRQSCRKHKVVRSAMKKVNFDCSSQRGEEKSIWDNSGDFFQSDGHTQAGRSTTGVSFCCVGEEDEFLPSVSTDNVDSLKTKYDRPLLHGFVSLKDFKGTRNQRLCNDSDKRHDIDNDDDNVDDTDGDSAMGRDEFSLSPPNSPLYDMPPPSTHAQKQARRAKRHLQLENWRKYEASKSRQERYQKRVQQSARSGYKSVVDSRRVKWSINLVQTVYFDDTHK